MIMLAFGAAFIERSRCIDGAINTFCLGWIGGGIASGFIIWLLMRMDK
jgi:hypothetical protein